MVLPTNDEKTMATECVEFESSKDNKNYKETVDDRTSQLKYVRYMMEKMVWRI